MSVKQRDPVTGHQTTGHEWNGIIELNTRVPRAVWWAIGISHIWALIYWILMPAWPLITTYTMGILGYDEQARVEREVLQAQQQRAAWTVDLETLPADDLREDPGVMTYVAQTAPALFGDNCAVCHGSFGQGGPGFPSLIDDAWLWGGDAQTILETLRVGINAPHPESRWAQMLNFGQTGVLSPREIRTVVEYVQSLSKQETETGAEALAAGGVIFADNCASCHGEDGRGIRDLGAPNLTDDFWIYGGDDASLYRSVYYGRQGWMPAWEDRLTAAERMALTLYVQDIGTEALR